MNVFTGNFVDADIMNRVDIHILSTDRDRVHCSLKRIGCCSHITVDRDPGGVGRNVRGPRCCIAAQEIAFDGEIQISFYTKVVHYEITMIDKIRITGDGSAEPVDIKLERFCIVARISVECADLSTAAGDDSVCAQVAACNECHIPVVGCIAVRIQIADIQVTLICNGDITGCPDNQITAHFGINRVVRRTDTAAGMDNKVSLCLNRGVRAVCSGNCGVSCCLRSGRICLRCRCIRCSSIGITACTGGIGLFRSGNGILFCRGICKLCGCRCSIVCFLSQSLGLLMGLLCLFFLLLQRLQKCFLQGFLCFDLGCFLFIGQAGITFYRFNLGVDCINCSLYRLDIQVSLCRVRFCSSCIAVFGSRISSSLCRLGSRGIRFVSSLLRLVFQACGMLIKHIRPVRRGICQILGIRCCLLRIGGILDGINGIGIAHITGCDHFGIALGRGDFQQGEVSALLFHMDLGSSGNEAAAAAVSGCGIHKDGIRRCAHAAAAIIVRIGMQYNAVALEQGTVIGPDITVCGNCSCVARRHIGRVNVRCCRNIGVLAGSDIGVRHAAAGDHGSVARAIIICIGGHVQISYASTGGHIDIAVCCNSARFRTLIAICICFCAAGYFTGHIYTCIAAGCCFLDDHVSGSTGCRSRIVQPEILIAVDVDNSLLRVCRDGQILCGDHMDISLIVHCHLAAHIHINGIFTASDRSVLGIDGCVAAGGDVLVTRCLFRSCPHISDIAVCSNRDIAIFCANLTQASAAFNFIEIDITIRRLGIQAPGGILDVLSNPVIADGSIHHPVAILIKVNSPGSLTSGCLFRNRCDDRGCVVPLLEIHGIRAASDIFACAQVHISTENILPVISCCKDAPILYIDRNITTFRLDPFNFQITASGDGNIDITIVIDSGVSGADTNLDMQCLRVRIGTSVCRLVRHLGLAEGLLLKLGLFLRGKQLSQERVEICDRLKHTALRRLDIEQGCQQG